MGSGIYNRLKNSMNGVKVASANSAHFRENHSECDVIHHGLCPA